MEKQYTYSQRFAHLALVHAGHNLRPGSPITASAFAKLISMQLAEQLTATQAKRVLTEMEERGGDADPAVIASEMGLEAMGADALAAAVDAAIAARPDDFEALRGGNQKVIGLFVGEVMKATGGKANGREVTTLLRERLKSVTG